MLKNYFRTALRIFARQRTYSLINILGLSVGLASSLLIFIYILDEVSYDKDLPDGDRIYRAGITERFQNQDINYLSTPIPLADAMRKEIPEVQASLRLTRNTDLLIRFKDKSFIENGVLMADSNFFSFFGYPLLEGDAKNCLRGPDKIVITENIAKKYFDYKGRGDSSPIGKILEFGSSHNAGEVTGIIADVPHNTHLKFEIVISLETWDYTIKDTCWPCYSLKTYFKINPSASIANVDRQLSSFAQNRILPKIRADLNVTQKQMDEKGDRVFFFIQSLASIHLNSSNEGEFEPNSDIRYIRLFGAVAVFIVLIACINFINMATARAVTRAKEVGVRKTIGANRSWLIQQFVLESFLYVIVSAILAIGIVIVLKNPFELLTTKRLTMDLFKNPSLLMGAFILILFVGVVSSIYPAIYLTSFKPSEVLKGKIVSRAGHAVFRNSLVILQFGVSIALVISTLTIYQQLRFIQNQKLGFQKENIIKISEGYSLRKNAEAFKNEIAKHSEFISASSSNQLPPTVTNTGFMKAEGTEQLFSCFQYAADYDHLKTMGYEMKSGRYFSRDFPSDSSAVIINEAFAKIINYENFEGKTLGIAKMKVIGIIKDFNFESLKNEIKPLAIFLNKEPEIITIRLTQGNVAEKISVAESVWKSFVPGMPFQYSFVDDNFEKQFKSEQQMGKLFFIFTGMAIFIACLGLFGLITFIAGQRTKEIGIRKVMGATRFQITGLLSGELIRLVLIAFFIAIPITWYGMTKWLEGFAYRTTFDFVHVALAGAIGIAAAFLTVSYKCYAAASRNPVDAIKNE